MPLRKLELIDDGTFNEVFSTKDPDKILRISKKPLKKQQYKELINEIELTHKIEQKLGVGNVIPHVYESIVKKGKKSRQIMERFDMCLNKYKQNHCFDTKEDLYDTACQAIDIFSQLLDIGIFCFDIKPQNFVINLEKVPYGYTGNKTNNFVRIIDLDTYFCNPIEHLIPDTYNSTQKKELFELFKSLLIIQFLSLYLKDDRNMLIEIAIKYNVCLSRKGINIFIDLVKNCKDKLLPRSYEQLCEHEWMKVYSLFEHYQATAFYKELPFCEFVHKNISFLPNNLPKIIHQIWLGDGKPPALVQSVIKGWETVSSWRHYLWRREDLKYLPVTVWIGDNVLFKKKSSKNSQKLQQIFLGVMKLEILYRIGGVYIDVGMKCNIDSDDKLEEFNDLISDNVDLELMVAHKYTKEKGPIQTDFLASQSGLSMIKTILTRKIFSKYDTFDQLFGNSIPKAKVKYIHDTQLFYPNGGKPVCSSTTPSKGFKPVNFGTASNRPKTLYIDSKCCKKDLFPESLMYKLF